MRILLAALLLAACTTQPTGECDMGLPTSRDETLTSASDVRSALINKLQDCVVGGKHGAMTLMLSFHRFHASGPGATGWNYGSWYLTDTTGGASCGIDLLVGQRILGMRIAMQDTVASSYLMRLYKTTLATAITGGTVVASTNASASTGVNQVLSASGLSEVIVAGASYQLVYGTSGGATAQQKIYYAELDIDHP